MCVYRCRHVHTCAHTHTQKKKKKTKQLKYYSAIKKELNNVICNKMDELREYYIKLSQTEKGKCYTIPLICGI